ncbi:Ubiquinone biosynthesis protein COQ7 homolog [Trichuris trichiura]|uniref:Ubiquinone biosynthesis protein COQ7 homolog n=1 Tax=Trichuris trichiura TaxID=36087 RepID=A0A077ZD80_TRITR|nr:Ubiquinone biosynthesis protein COQ7 homolog [Trichuris trichiura]
MNPVDVEICLNVSYVLTTPEKLAPTISIPANCLSLEEPRMKTQEARHLSKFEDLINKEAIRPTALLPLWNVAGFALGVITASLGRQAAMACTVAVEELIGQHYNDQIRELMSDSEEAHKELIQTLKEFRDDELEHLDCGIQNDAEKAPFYTLLTWLVQTGCKSAIWISERV